MHTYQQMNREMSWLSFNYRVLQEAVDPDVPLYEKIKFMAIYSSNLDEFYRVRVASYRNLLELKKKARKKLSFDPAALINQINKTVFRQQEELGRILREVIIPGLNQQNIFLIDETKLTDSQRSFIRDYFEAEIHPFIQPIVLVKKKVSPFLRNRILYFAIQLSSLSGRQSINDGNPRNVKHKYALVEIPSERISRFVVLPEEDGNRYIMMLDDVVCYFLPQFFPGYTIESAFAIKLTRDAEIYIDDEFSGDLRDKIRKGLSRRKTGMPSRFLFDKNMPADFLGFLKEALQLSKQDLVEGGRYHNFHDFMAFPRFGMREFEDIPLPALPCNQLETAGSYFEYIRSHDILIAYPYQKYDYVLKFLDQAVNDEQVEEIAITLYRVSGQSLVVASLIAAAQKGKRVLAFVELKARFDEESNMQWASRMTQTGVKVYYSFPGLKVHSKLLLITRREKKRRFRYAYLSTGNFNEKTARIYSDLGLFTANTKITSELAKVFQYLSRKKDSLQPDLLLVAPFNMRRRFTELVNNEIEQARKGNEAGITLKLNSLQDSKMIDLLYEASNAGVKIRIIVRGICCLVPGVSGQSENIEAISIVDRFLEHSRVYIFENGGDALMFSGSADWMKRNLSRRIEVIFPVLDKDIARQIRDMVEIQWRDNVKARIIDAGQSNPYRESGRPAVQAQPKIYEYIKETQELTSGAKQAGS